MEGIQTRIPQLYTKNEVKLNGKGRSIDIIISIYKCLIIKVHCGFVITVNFRAFSHVSRVGIELSDPKSQVATELKEIFAFVFVFPVTRSKR